MKKLTALFSAAIILLPLYYVTIHTSSSSEISKFECLSYDPRHRFGYLNEKKLADKTTIETSWIENDLSRISDKTDCIRTYYTTKGMQMVPEIAARYGLEVILGVALRAERSDNMAEINSAIQLSNTYKNIKYVLAGNEILLGNYLNDREHVPLKELLYAVKSIRDAVNQPVSFAEPLNSWKSDPTLTDSVDFIALNEIPYWAKIEAENTSTWLDNILKEASLISKGKNIFISETGWPFRGPSNGAAKTGISEFNKFISQLESWSRKNNISYNIIEAFDQPWKSAQFEGRVGAHWGVFDAWGNYKFNLHSSESAWLYSGIVACLIISGLFLATLRNVNMQMLIYSAFFCQITVLLSSVILYTIYSEYLFGTWLFSLIILPAALLLFIMVFIYLREAALILGRRELRANNFKPLINQPTALPFVSVHVACSNEPASQVISTIESLLKLDYPEFEIIVVDNNTYDSELWQPVEKFCKMHAAVKFFHLENLSGYKAGALNYALSETDTRAEIIGLVDSDYVVSNNWLKDLIPVLKENRVAAVQAPQSHRCWENSVFSTSLRDEYEGFFHTGMVIRDLDNALIQHGSMVLIKRSAIEQAGNWNTECITEDTELGLRLLSAGYEIRYINKEYGAGLVPLSFHSYKKQRARWVMGAMQILRIHSKELFRINSGKLNPFQRYHFISGWLPWISDIFSPLFTIFGLMLSAFIIYSPKYMPPQELAYPIIYYFFFRQITVCFLYSKILKIGPLRTALCSIASMSLTSTIAIAVVKGIFLRKIRFERTEKSTNNLSANRKQTNQTSFEYIPGILLLIFAVIILFRYGITSNDTAVWCLAFIIQSISSLSCLAIIFLQNSREKFSVLSQVK